MTRIPSWLLLTILGLLVLSGAAISAQDKYTVQVPGGLAFSEFKGYENWQVISVSHAGDFLEGKELRFHSLSEKVSPECSCRAAEHPVEVSHDTQSRIRCRLCRNPGSFHYRLSLDN